MPCDLLEEGREIAPPKMCEVCGVNPKPSGRGVRFCTNCKSERSTKCKNLCIRCLVNPRRPGRGCKYCETCIPKDFCSTCHINPRHPGFKQTQRSEERRVGQECS